MINYIYYQYYKTFFNLYFKAPNTANTNYEVQLFYNKIRLDGSVNLNGIIIVKFIPKTLWESWLSWSYVSYDLELSMQSVSITNKVVSSNPSWHDVTLYNILW